MAGNWKEPEFDFSERSDRVTLKLEVGQVVYIPGAADIRNENTDQAELKSMSKEERILEYNTNTIYTILEQRQWSVLVIFI